MDFGLSQEQTLLADSVGRFLDDRVTLDAVRAFAGSSHGSGDDSAIWRGLAELGIPGLLVADNHGGVGLAGLEAALVAEALGYRAAPAPWLGTAVAAPLALAASVTDQSRRLAALAAGELRIGLAAGEAVAARADAGVTVSAGKLTGRSLFVTDFPADAYLVADRDHGLHLVQADAAGLATRTLTTIDRTRPTGELTLDQVPAELVSEDPAVLGRVVDAARVMLAADTLGAAQSMLDKAVAYAGERRQFNRPIGSFQAVKHLCAEMAAALEPCRAMVWYAAHALDHLPREAHLTACHTKAHLSEVGTFVARTATEVHGGMGFTDLLGLHYWFKRIGYNRQLLGAPELLREEAARAQLLPA